MKALQIAYPGRFEIKDVPVPEPGPGEVLVKVLAVTTCPHWDMHILDGVPMFPGAPLDYPYTLGQPGHEACGEIVSVGERVHEVSPGQRVSVWRDRGHHVQGCYAQYVAVDVESVISVPRELPPEACAPVELAMCVSAHALYAEKLDAIAGKRVGVFGLGPAGLVFVQVARAAGAAEIIGVDPLAARRDLAQRLGAARVLNPTEDAMAGFPKRGQPGCLDTAFDCAGIPSAVHQAMDLTNHVVVLFAVQREPYTYAPHHWPGLTLAGTRPHTREAAEYAVKRIEQGKLDLASLVTHKMPLQDYAHAVDLLKRQEAVKVAFMPQE